MTETLHKADRPSEVIEDWIASIQCPMPNNMRNSEEWRALIPDAAGTGREHESKRLAMIMDWMWSTVAPQGQQVADAYGFGIEWREMCEKKTQKAAQAAELAAATWTPKKLLAEEAAERAGVAAAQEAWAGAAAAWMVAARAAERVAEARAIGAPDAANAARVMKFAAKYLAEKDLSRAAGLAGTVTGILAAAVSNGNYWRAIDPPGLLRRLINLETGK